MVSLVKYKLGPDIMLTLGSTAFNDVRVCKSFFSLIISLIVTVIISFYSPIEVLADEAPKIEKPNHFLGIILGSGIGSFREDLIVPISFDGPVFLLGGQYTKKTSFSSFQIRFNFSAALLKNRFSHKAYAAQLGLRPSWTKLVWNNGADKQIWCGISFPLQMRNLLMDSWDDSHLYWFTTYSAAIVGEYHTHLPYFGNSIIRLDLPIVGFISRPPDYRYQKQESLNHFSYHFSAPNSSFGFKGIWQYQSPVFQIMINRNSKGSLLNFGLELTFDHYSKPKDIWILSTGLLFCYQWKI